ncbi:MAG: nuclear transport factor 2 family protein [Cyanobacteria bacterium J06627_8]
MSNSPSNWPQFSDLLPSGQSSGQYSRRFKRGGLPSKKPMGLMGANLLAVAIALSSVAEPAKADLQAPETAPGALTQLLSDIDAAANSRDIDRVMEFVSDDFVHSDGLTADTLEDSTQAFWDRFDALNYSTEIIGWESDGDDWTVQTLTTVIGLDVIGNRSGRLEATVESRQQFEDGVLVEQTILSEESQITLGDNSPIVDVNLAEQVGVGESFSFDAIVLEPLGNRILLGTAFDEPVDVDGYLNPAVITLDLLSAGGLFKVGVAPAEVGDRWISAVVVRDDGITALTRRLQVVPPGEVSNTP